jgi:hypothetical protein
VSFVDTATLQRHAAWTLTAALMLSVTYGVWRATARFGVSRHDTPGALVQLVPAYVLAAGVIAALFIDLHAAVPIGLVFSVLVIGVSTFHYDPVMMLERQPKVIDWFGDIATRSRTPSPTRSWPMRSPGSRPSSDREGRRCAEGEPPGGTARHRPARETYPRPRSPMSPPTVAGEGASVRYSGVECRLGGKASPCSRLACCS